MFAPTILALLLVLLLVLSWGLAVAETALSYISRKQVEGIALRKPKNSVVTVMARLPEHLHALRFWRLFSETTAAVMVTLLFDYFLDSIVFSAICAAIFMGLVCLLLVVWSPRAVGARHEVAAVTLTSGLVRVLTAMLGPLPARFASPGFRTEDDEEETAEIEERHFREYVSRAHDADVLEDAEAELIQSVFDMGDTIVRAVMVPRTDVVTLETGTTLEESLSVFLRSGNSRIPLIGEDADDVKGMIYLKDLVRAMHRDRADIKDPVDHLVREVRFVPESKPVSVLLQELQRESTHIAIVVDEYGGTAGLVTLEDLIEEIVGDIADEYDPQDSADIQPVAEGEFLVNTRMGISDFAEAFDLHMEQDEDVDTVGGLLAKSLGKVPIQGSETTLEGLTLRAEKLEGRRNRVSTIRVLLAKEQPSQHPTDDLDNIAAAHSTADRPRTEAQE